MELNDDKRELPRTATRHLGFRVDLQGKFVLISRKHRGKILTFFDNFVISAKRGRRIRVRDMQRMLGLQIWISTAFRIARQFLTSLCNTLRAVQKPGSTELEVWFYPRKHKGLVRRVLFDLKFWWRFVLTRPVTSFDYLLGRLPRNDSRMYSDASSLHGMGGVLIFGESGRRAYPRVEGVFWQLTWHEWQAVKSMGDFQPGCVKINRAEFLAALISCETFVAHCEHKITIFALDNLVAKRWFDSARCPIYPLDRCAQGVALFMLQREMKVATTWVSSKKNTFADTCSRKTFVAKSKSSVHRIAGARLLKVSPKWSNVIKLL